MMANPARGEVALSVAGRPRRLRLSLGALAALEAATGAGGLVALAERFERADMAAEDVIDVLTAGFMGAGTPLERAEVAALDIDGGAPAALAAAMGLLRGAFGAAP